METTKSILLSVRTRGEERHRCGGLPTTGRPPWLCASTPPSAGTEPDDAVPCSSSRRCVPRASTSRDTDRGRSRLRTSQLPGIRLTSAAIWTAWLRLNSHRAVERHSARQRHRSCPRRHPVPRHCTPRQHGTPMTPIQLIHNRRSGHSRAPIWRPPEETQITYSRARTPVRVSGRSSSTSYGSGDGVLWACRTWSGIYAPRPVVTRKVGERGRLQLPLALATDARPIGGAVRDRLGYIVRGVLATVVGLAFVIPFFVRDGALGISVLYVAYGGLWWDAGALHGVGAAVGDHRHRAWQPARGTIKRDPLLWGIFAVLMIVTVATQAELALLFVLAGLAVLLGPGLPRSD